MSALRYALIIILFTSFSIPYTIKEYSSNYIKVGYTLVIIDIVLNAFIELFSLFIIFS